MKSRLYLLSVLAVSTFLILYIVGGLGNQSTAADSGGRAYQIPAARSWTNSTQFRRTMLKLLLAEANDVARNLNLRERLPILETDVTEVVLATPRIDRLTGIAGAISTSNYQYSFAAGYKFSILTPLHGFKNSSTEIQRLTNAYTWPIERFNSNIAVEIATQRLASLNIDTAALSRDCQLRVTTALRTDMTHFVPMYAVIWQKLDGGLPVAVCDIFQPNGSVYDLYIDDSMYILRKPIAVPGILAVTNLSSP